MELLPRERVVGIEQHIVAFDGEAAGWVQPVAAAGYRVLTADGDQLTVAVDTAAQVPDLVAMLVHAGARVRRVVSDDPSLEEAYLDLLRRHG